jgi:hypothetical protein
MTEFLSVGNRTLFPQNELCKYFIALRLALETEKWRRLILLSSAGLHRLTKAPSWGFLSLRTGV